MVTSNPHNHDQILSSFLIPTARVLFLIITSFLSRRHYFNQYNFFPLKNESILDMSKDEVFEILIKFSTYICIELCLHNLELMALYILKVIL